MKDNLKSNNKGITLVALVITIIILLILARITINTLTENALFEKAKLAKEQAKNAENLENQIIYEYEKEIGKYIDGTRNNFQGTVWYPDGTEQEPTNISLGQRITVQNPYPGKKLHLVVQICLNGIWSETGFIYAGTGGYGINAVQRQGNEIDEIAIQSGKIALVAAPIDGGCGFTNEELAYVSTSLPYRLLITCLD